MTTNPNSVVGRVHDRMPVVIKPDMEELYLSEPDIDDLLFTIAQPYSDAFMEAQEVGQL